MKELLNVVSPVIYLFMGMIFTLVASRYNTSKTDNRKINKLLFNLLDIRSNLIQLKTFDGEFKEITNRFIERYFPNQKDIHTSAGNTIIDSIGAALKQNLPFVESMDQVIQEIDEGVLEISEVHPVLAYELKNEYNIKSKLKSMNNYLDETKKKFGMYDSELITKFYEPLFLQKTIDNLDKHIQEISRKTSRSKNKRILKILNKKIEFDSKKVDQEVDKMIRIVNELQGRSTAN